MGSYKSLSSRKHMTKNYEICKENDLPRQISLYMLTISSPDLKFCPDLFGDLKSKSYFVPTLWANKNAKLQLFYKQAVALHRN